MNFVFVAPVWGMDNEAVQGQPVIAMKILAKSLVQASNYRDPKNLEKCQSCGWNYTSSDVLVKVAISCQDIDGRIIDCLKGNPALLRRAIIKQSTNPSINDVRSPQLPEYIPLRVLSEQKNCEIILHGCHMNAEISFDGCKISDEVSGPDASDFVVGGGIVGVIVLGYYLFLERMMLFGV